MTRPPPCIPDVDGTARRRCPVCPDGYATAIIAMNTRPPGGVAVWYVCWHGIEVQPPEWSVQHKTASR